MNARLTAAAAVLAALLASTSAHAAMIVYDPASYGKLIEQAKTALDQLQALKARVQQGQQLLDSLNHASGVGAVGAQISSPALRQLVPDVSALTAAAQGDVAALGAIGARAKEIRSASRLYTPAANDPSGTDLEVAGLRAARDQALGEAVANGGAQRLSALQALQQAIDTAPNVRAVLDLQARALAEQAMIANDQMRLQGLAMAQAAEQRLQIQRDQERVAAAREARMALYRRGFQ
jgi:type IV secretion system protein VirB5